MRFREFAIAVGICVMSIPAIGAELPEGPGRDAVKKVCAKCHEIETVVASRRTRIAWQQMTDDMVSRGAKGSDEELVAVVDYLTVHYGKVNVNTATVEDLTDLLGLSEKEAKAILAYREQNGAFKSFDDLQKAGLSADRLKEKRPQIALSR